MSSVVFYKFKSQKEPSRIAFDGTGISVWELKKEIILEAKLGKGTDFDFSIYNENDEEYTDDHAVIPRSTSILARRLPPSKPGRGNGQIYMAAIEGNSGAPSGAKGYQNTNSGGGGGSGAGGSGWKAGSMSKRFDGREEQRVGGNGAGGDVKSSNQEPSQVMLPAAASGDEASALAAMFAATSQQWQQTQEQMASATPIYRAPMPRVARPPPPPRDHSAPAPLSINLSTTTTTTSTSTSTTSLPSIPGVAAISAQPSSSAASSQIAAAYQPQQISASHKPPPSGYICYRCGQKGHWIQDCPTNADKTWDDKPRIKRTTGIPKSFLTVVEGPVAGTGSHDVNSANASGSGVMVTPDGGFVVARPDNDSWLAHRSLTANLSATDIQNLAPTDPDLTCPICSKLLRDSVLTPCCKTAFCEDCLHNSLGDNDMLCPECESRIKNLGKLEIDKGRRERCKNYIAEMVEASKEEIPVIKEEESVPVVEVVKEVEAIPESVVVKEETKAEEVVQPMVNKEVVINHVAGGDALDSLIASVTSGGPTPNLKSLATDLASNSSIPSGPSQINHAFIQQQQFLRQQQMQQQQQRAMMQQQQQQQGMGISPQMLQQQIYQINMTLSNPQLHPQMRMNLQMQLQQCQMMAVQMGLIPVAGSHTLGNSIAQAYGGNFANGMRNGVNQQQQQQQGMMGMNMNGMRPPQLQYQGSTQIPTGPRGVTSESLKRTRPEDFVDGSPDRKRTVSPAQEVPKGPPM